jgi:hypothetical protein
MIKKIILFILVALLLVFTSYMIFISVATYSEGVRSGELIKISNKGYLFKTWEGEASQGIAGAQIFQFSVLDQDENVINDLKKYQGEYVKLEYVERYRTFPWWGDTRYFIKKVAKETSPFKIK